MARATLAAPRIILISDLGQVPEAELVRRVSALGPAAWVQLRDVDLQARQRLALGRRLRAATRAAGAGLFVNDRLDLALELGADGVHLGGRSVAVADARRLVGDAFVTCACHAVDEVLGAADAGADGALLSPIFASPGKGAPLGVAALARARAVLDARGHGGFALYALGGVDGAGAGACAAAGAGLAVIRADPTSWPRDIRIADEDPG